MIENFPEVVDYHFTAQMENNLDEISDGKITMNSVLSEFYDRFEASLEKANVNVSKEQLPMEETGQICELCGSKMVVKTGRYGKFIACPNYPTCKNTKPYLEEGTKQQESTEIVSDQICEKCGAPMVLRSGRYGSFLACSNYPTCKTTLKLQPKIGVNCPLCGSPIVSKRAKGKMIFYSCSDYPKCQFSSWDKPTNEICPSCGKILYLKKGKDLLICKNESCHFTKTVDPNKDKLKSEENL
jgi:DNA topoisomerase-1